MLLAFTNNTRYEQGDSLRRDIYSKYQSIPIYDTDDFTLEDCTKAMVKKAHKSGVIIDNLKFYQSGSKTLFYEKGMPVCVQNLGNGVKIAFLGRFNAYQCGDWFHVGRYGGIVTIVTWSKEFLGLVSPPVLEDGRFVVKLYTLNHGIFMYKETRPIEDSKSVYIKRPNGINQLLKGIVNCTCESEIESYIHTYLGFN